MGKDDYSFADTEEMAKSINVMEEGRFEDEPEPFQHPKKPSKHQARAYQQAAFEAVCKENRIVCLPTGTGKTLVATMAIDYFLQGQESAFVCFIVNQVALVKQQAEAIRQNSTIDNIQVAEVRGDGRRRDRDAWAKLRKNHVLVTTAEVLKSALVDHGFLQLDADCKLLVFDEAHHAIGNHPFVKILEKVTWLPQK